MQSRKRFLFIPLIILVLILGGWGQVGHKIINKNAVLSFPPQMSPFLYWADQLANHASDADNRKGSDPSESPKHFIDIDSYQEFISTGRISQNYDSVVALHGASFVTSEGILPWAIITTEDSLTAAFKREDWNKAILIAADLGHYIADAHQPLHITKNYNPGGLHSRYETTMIDKYDSQISYGGDSVSFISNVPDFVFSTIYKNYPYVDSVIEADKQANTFAGSTKSDAYYQKLWELTGAFTDSLFSSASNKLAALIYTAWINAGSPLPATSDVLENTNTNFAYTLEQNYPNPFNNSTSFFYKSSINSHITIKIYNTLGEQIAVLLDDFSLAGIYKINFNAADLPSGIYFYRMTAGKNTITRKMILMK